MINKHKLMGILVVLAFLTSCSDQRILEMTGFIQSASYDLLPNGKISYGISVPIANVKIKTAREFLRTEAKSATEARVMLAKQTNLMLVSGQLRTALFDLTLAEQGIWSQMDTLMRDPTITEQAKIIIVNGNAGNLLEKNYKEYPQTGVYIDQLVQKEATNQSLPRTTIYSFTRDYYDDGIDPIAPIIRDAGESIEVDGIALFKKDKYIGKINAEDSLVFAALLSEFKQGDISFDISEGPLKNVAVMLSSLRSSRKVNITHNKGQITIRINVKAIASVLEYFGELNLSNAAEKQKLEREISDIMTQRAVKIIKLLQEKNADSLGIGVHVRNSMSYSAWKKFNWHEQYPNVNVQCTVKIKIKDHGFRR